MGKAEERAQLHKAIWKIANDLRGSVDGWDFKAYVLGFLFYRFISENLTDYLNAEERAAADGDPDFDYARLDDADAEFAREEIVRTKGFFIRPSELFCNVRAVARSDENLNERLSRVFRYIEGSAQGTGSESDLRGLFDDIDVNSAKLGNTVAERNAKLVKIMDAIGDLDLSYGRSSIDAFGDAYEYLMTMYASSAGKSGGEFFTPQEVSEVLATIAADGRARVGRVYDPCAGSGSLLLKFAKVLGTENVGAFFGQEINLTTYNLCRINMFLHDVNFSHFDIALGNTLTAPAHWDDQPFDAIVSNPPYSTKWVGKDDPALINDPRFSPAGVLAPKSYADLAFTMHMLDWLDVAGTAAIVEFPGVLYRGGGGGEDPPLPGGQQLRARGHPTAAGLVLRHDDRHLCHRVEEVQAGFPCPLRRRFEGVRARGQQEPLGRAEPGARPLPAGGQGRRGARGGLGLPAGHRGQRLQPVGVELRGAGGHS
mgnify:CR=1 FL=1